MHFSLFLTTRSTDPSEDRAIMHAMIEHAREGERLGFEAIFQPDHHFTGYAPQSSDPFIFAAYMAALMPKMWFGFSVQTVPLHHPVRFAERLALLDQLTDGKLLVGVGSGTTPEESIGLGVNFKDTSRISVENLEIIEKLWRKQQTDEPVVFDTGTYKGAVVSRISPTPYTQPVPTMMSVAARPSSVERSATLGQPAFILNFAPPHDLFPENPFDTFKANYLRYRLALEAAGHPEAVLKKALEWTTHSYQFIHVADTDEQAAEELEVLLQQYQKTVEREHAGNKAAEKLTGVDLPMYPDALSDTYKRIWTLSGSPETVVEKLRPYYDLGVGNISGAFMGGPLTEERKKGTAQSMRLFAEKVMPHFQGAERS